MNSRKVLILSAVAIAVFALAGKPDVVTASGDEDLIQKLRGRLGALERTVESQQTQLRDFRSMKLRLIRLEQSVQNNRPSTTGSVPASSSEIAKLKQDSTLLKNSVRRLESKFTGFENSNLQREISRLGQKVSSLESAVRRLESKR